MSHSSTSQLHSRFKLTSSAVLPPSDRSSLTASLLNTKRRVNARELLAKLTTVKSKPTEAEIRRNLALLTNIARPLSPTLPPSPPISPKPLKRKSPDNDGDNGVDPAKRARTTSDGAAAATGNASPSSSSSLTSLDRSASSSGSSDRLAAATNKEEGEVTDHRGSASGSKDPSPSTNPRPAPPPRQRQTLTPDKLNQMSIAYQEKAKTLKRSADKRFALAKTEEVNLYASLEQVDSGLLFAYGFWARSASGARDPNTWETLLTYISSIRSRWQKRTLNTASYPPTKEYVTAKMMLGVLDMVRFCALSQLHRYYSQKLQATQTRDRASPTPNGNHGSNTPPGSFQLTPPPPYTSASTVSSSHGGHSHNGARPNTGPSPASSSSSGGHQQHSSTNTPPTTSLTAHVNGNNGNHGPNSVTQSPHQLATGGSPAGSVSVSVDTVALLTKVLQTSAQLAEASGYGSLMTLHDLRKYFPVTYAVSTGDNASTGKPLRPGMREDAFQVDVLA
ncbi:hypothetical protein FRB98_004990, partial [Tulasnella sp. 332]